MSELFEGVTVNDVVPGNPGEVNESAGRFSDMASLLGDVHSDLRNLGTTGWEGPAATAFKGVVGDQPSKFANAEDAFQSASSALASYSTALSEAQSQALRAISLYHDSVAASRQSSGGSDGGSSTSAESSAGMASAERMLANAKGTLEVALSATRNSIQGALSMAPKKPGLIDRLIKDDIEIVHEELHLTVEFAKGLYDGSIGGIVAIAMLEYKFYDMIYQSNPVTDPSGWKKHVIADAKGASALYGAAHTAAFYKSIGKNMLNWNEWKTDPARAFGAIVPAIALAVVTAGGGAAADGAADASEAVADGAVDGLADTAADTTADTAANVSTRAADPAVEAVDASEDAPPSLISRVGSATKTAIKDTFDPKAAIEDDVKDLQGDALHQISALNDLAGKEDAVLTPDVPPENGQSKNQ